MNRHVISVALAVTFAATCFTSAASAQSLPQRSPDFVPLGVYLAWEALDSVADKWAWVDAALTDMAAHDINTVWLVNTSLATMKEFAIRAEPHGVYVIPNPMEINGRYGILDKTVEEQKAVVTNVMAAWGDAPKPLAWGIYDEPGAEHATKITQFMSAWDQVAPEEPVTVVTFTGGPVPSLRATGLEYICADMYYFWQNNNPLGPEGAIAYWNVLVDPMEGLLKPYGARAWVMGQTFQDVKQPVSINAEEHLVIGPGGGVSWRMPTPAEMRWQAWATFAYGSKGYFAFIYSYPILTTTSSSTTIFSQTYDTNAPTGLATFPSLHSTPEYEANADVFAKIEAMHDTVAVLEPTTLASPPLSLGGTPTFGSMVRVFTHPSTGDLYAYVVAGFTGPAVQDVVVNVNADAVALVDQNSATITTLTSPQDTLTFDSGDGALYQLIVNPDADDDTDGLSNIEEYNLETDPNEEDTDGDGLLDGHEVALGTDPLNIDTDGDGVMDGIEVTFGHDPLNASDTPELPIAAAPVAVFLLVVGVGVAMRRRLRRT